MDGFGEMVLFAGFSNLFFFDWWGWGEYLVLSDGTTMTACCRCTVDERSFQASWPFVVSSWAKLCHGYSCCPPSLQWLADQIVCGKADAYRDWALHLNTRKSIKCHELTVIAYPVHADSFVKPSDQPFVQPNVDQCPHHSLVGWNLAGLHSPSHNVQRVRRELSWKWPKAFQFFLKFVTDNAGHSSKHHSEKWIHWSITQFFWKIQMWFYIKTCILWLL
jgi:hypothetical protein